MGSPPHSSFTAGDLSRSEADEIAHAGAHRVQTPYLKSTKQAFENLPQKAKSLLVDRKEKLKV